jgi:cysteine-rich repeat protein
VCTETCGDGYNFKKITGGTPCDDGGTAGGDGCSASCLVETGYTCTGGSKTTADTCSEVCGDGYNFNTAGTG